MQDSDLQKFIRTAAEEAAKRAAREALESLCRYIDVDPNDVDSVRELREDFRHLRKWRQTTEKIRGSGWTAAMTFAVTGLCGLFVIGISAWLHGVLALGATK